MTATYDMRADALHLGQPHPPNIALPAVNGATYYHGVMIADVAGVATKVTAAAGLKIIGYCDNAKFTADTSKPGQDEVSVIIGIRGYKISSTDPVTTSDQFTIVYAEGDDTIAKTSAGGTISPSGMLYRVVGTTAYVVVGYFGSAAALVTSQASWGADVANAAALQAVAAADRFNGQKRLKLDSDTFWTFDSGSAAAASDWVIVPDAGTGRWLRNHVSLADLSAVTAAHGSALIGSEDAGGFTAATTVEAQLQELYQHLLSAQATIPLSLFDWREVSAGGDVANTAGIGGVLASDTTPIHRADAAESQEIVWAAGNTDIIGTQIALPADFDDTADVKIQLRVYTDNAGGGGIDAATFTVETGWDGGALVSDTATDGTPAITHHTIEATIAAADIPAGASYVTIYLTPAAHAADPTQLVSARILYKRKLLTS